MDLPSASRAPRLLQLLGACALATGLAGCYVVPIQPTPPGPAVIAVPAPPPPGPVTFSARLYPSNEAAAGYGMVMAVVVNDLNGRGTFSTNIGGESFAGEATRQTPTAREGVANGAGNRGGYISCRYAMNNATQGTGQCRLSNGATFTMHLGT